MVAVPQPAPAGKRPSRRASSTLARLRILEAFVETSNDAMFSIDKAGRIAIWNHSAVRVFGYDASDISGSEWTALFPDRLRPTLEVVFNAVAYGGRIDHYETEIERRDGTQTPISLSLDRGVRRRHPSGISRGGARHRGAAPRPGDAG